MAAKAFQSGGLEEREAVVRLMQLVAGAPPVEAIFPAKSFLCIGYESTADEF